MSLTPVHPLDLSCQGRNAGQGSRAENTCTRPGLVTPPGQHLRHAVFLAKVFPLNELHFQAGGTSQRHGVITDRVTQGFGEQTQIDATNAGEVKLPLQCAGMTHVEQIAGDHNMVKTPQLSGNL